MFCVFYFIKISKFALPGVMLIYERTSKDRKKERKKENGRRRCADRLVPDKKYFACFFLTSVLFCSLITHFQKGNFLKTI